MKLKKPAVVKFFGAYCREFNRALTGKADYEKIAGMYSERFLGAGPQGVMTGKNGWKLRLVMRAAYRHYRKSGMQSIRVKSVDVTPIDDLHAMAKVRWDSTYLVNEKAKRVEFDVTYLVQAREGRAKVFAFIAGDEEQALRKRGITR
jgi:hypothetical protein